METNNPNNAQNNNEIDLLDILKRTGKITGKGLNSVAKISIAAIRITLIFLIKKILWLPGFIVIGIAVSALLYTKLPRTYSAIMTIRTNVLDNTHMIDYVNELGRIKDPVILARTLNIPDSVAKYIVDIGAFYGISTSRDSILSYIDFKHSFKHSPRDTMPHRIPRIFYLRVISTSHNPDVFRFIGNNLVDVMNANSYAVEYNSTRLQQLQERLAEINYQLDLLDSVQRIDYFKNPREAKATLGQLLLTNEKDRRLYHGDILYLFNMKLPIERALAEYNQLPVTVVQDFSPQLTIESLSLRDYLKKYVPLSLIVGIILLIIIDHRKKMRNWIFQQ